MKRHGVVFSGGNMEGAWCPILWVLIFHERVRIFCGCGLRRYFVFVAFYATREFSRLFLLLGRPQGQQVEAFWSKDIAILKK